MEQHIFIHYFWGWFLYKDISFVSKFSLFLLFFALLFVLLIFLIAFFFSFLLCLQLLLVQVLKEIFILLNSLLLLFRGFRVFALLSRPLPVPLGKFSCRECLIRYEKSDCPHILAACSSLPFDRSIPFPETLGQSPPSPRKQSKVFESEKKTHLQKNHKNLDQSRKGF